MDRKEHLTHIWKYNQWANSTLFAAIPSEVVDMEISSSFNTIRKTIYHMWDAETLWLERMQQQEITPWPASGNFKGTIEEAYSQIKDQENIYIQFVQEQDLEKTLTYKNLKGDDFTNTYGEILSHVANHSTFHRGQIVTMLRQAGVTTIPQTDLIAYYRKK